MALGDSLFGEGLMGEDDVARAVSAGIIPPRAPRFDPSTRDYPLDDNGLYQDIHPIDSQVILALTVEFGKISSASTTGQTLREIPSPQGRRVKSDVDLRVRSALSRLTKRGSIAILKIGHSSPNRHTLHVAVEYMNNQTRRREKALALASSS